MKVRARVVLAGLAIALGIDRLFAQFIHGAAQLQFSMRGKGHAALRQLRGNNTVEHIDPTMYALENINRRAHAHEVTRQILRQMVGDESRHFVTLVLRFADGQAANSEAVKREFS